MAAQICHRLEFVAILCAHREDFVEFVVRNRRGVRRAASGCVLDTAHSGVEVAAFDRRVDLTELHLNEFGPPPESLRDFFGDFDIESAELHRIARIGLDEWSASFRVPAPSKRRSAGD